MMRSLILSILYLIFCFVSTIGQAQENLRGQIKTAIKAVDPNVNVGIVVLPLSQNERQANPLFFMHGSRFFTLASTTKVLTAIMSLKTLGPEFTFKTSLYDQQTPNTHDLYLDFNGDPTVTSKKLSVLIEKGMRVQKRKTPFDNLYIALPHHSFTPTAAGWMVGDTAYCFAAPVHNIIIDENCIDLNDPAQEDLVKKIGVSQKVITSKRTPNDFMGYISYKIDTLNKNQKLAKKQDFKKIRLPQQHFRLLSSFDSPPLSDLLHPILKDSENLPTEALYLELGKRQNLSQWGPVGDWTLSKFEELYNLDMTGAIMTDGSGLSRYNSLTPMQLARVLEAAYYDRQIIGPFMRALPKMGVDGSLKLRLQKSPLKGKFIGKTGTMTGVSTIGGYLTVKNQKYVTVVFMNNYTENKQRYRKLQDKILEIIYKDLSG